MRFDDRLATVLGYAPENPAARLIVWRQLVDLLAQDAHESSAIRDQALDRLRAWRPDMPQVARQNAAMLLGGRPVPPDLVQFFAEDSTAVCAPLLAVTALPAQGWTTLIPRLSPVARALLRHRRDLPEEAVRALNMFGAADLVIPSPPPSAQPSPDIHQLRARIEAFGEGQTGALPAPAPEPEAEFSFETGADGVIHWCDLRNRGAAIGLSIAVAASPHGNGVDGQAAGAFRRRAPFRDARLTIARAGPAGGAWSISGVPCFDPPTGRFIGYRGSARRPRVGERAEPGGVLGSTLSGDSLRQLAHEVRTPLNAIMGFAEMIERQMLGPAASAYRTKATAILSETRQLQAVLDELEEAAQLDAAEPSPAREHVDPALMLARITAALHPSAAEKGVLIALSIAPGCAPVLADPAAAERMTMRLLSAAVGLARTGERIEVALAPGQALRPETWLTIGRPAMLADYDETSLFDACDVPGEDERAPILGLGFALRLVRGYAESCGGCLVIAPGHFRLRLKAVQIDVPVETEKAAAPEQVSAGEWAEWVRRNSPVAACHGGDGSAIAPAPGGACSSMVELAAHNGLVGGSNPSGPTGAPA